MTFQINYFWRILFVTIHNVILMQSMSLDAEGRQLEATVAKSV